MRIEEIGVWLTPPETTYLQSLTLGVASDIWQEARIGSIEWIDSVVPAELPLNVSYERRYLGRWLLARMTWKEADGEVIRVDLSEEQLRRLRDMVADSLAYNMHMVEHVEEHMAEQERLSRELAGESEIPGITDITEEDREGLKHELRRTALVDIELENKLAVVLKGHLDEK